MRRYSSLNNCRDSDSRDEGDGVGGGVEGGGRNHEEDTPFTDYLPEENRRYKRTFCLVFTLFFGGLVRSLTKYLYNCNNSYLLIELFS
jgi:hypothetical protein